MDISFISAAAKQAYNIPASHGDQVQVPVAPRAQQTPVEITVPADTQLPDQDTQRKQAVERAAQAFKNTFPVSDVRFTIFKDGGGQYITRFTSLRDGKVTYYPEQTMFAFFQKLGDQSNALVRINA